MIEAIEEKRITQQAELDSLKEAQERNRLGQFATPPPLAQHILQHAKRLLGKRSVRFLDPALGTGAFYSALRATFAPRNIKVAVGYEIDRDFAAAATSLWGKQGLSVMAEDFTKAEPAQFDLIICNPPYVRHHHIGADKERLLQRTRDLSDVKVSGLAGLYVHFLLQSHAWMAPGAIAGWLIPSEFMNVNYGSAVKRYLREQVTLLQLHRFDPDDVQFADALVSSAVVWIKNEPAPKRHKPLFTFGGSLDKPNITAEIDVSLLGDSDKWIRYPQKNQRSRPAKVRLGDLFKITRGIATGNNAYFILNEASVKKHQLPRAVLRPILPSPRYLGVNDVLTDKKGVPTNTHKLFLLDTHLDEATIASRYPALSAYLSDGRSAGTHQRYLCSKRKRWYEQDRRDPAPLVCTYFGRADGKSGRPFRFIRNRSAATVTNTYLALYPKPALAIYLQNDPDALDRIWLELNQIPADTLLEEARVYGGGLYKLEPRELANVPLAAM